MIELKNIHKTFVTKTNTVLALQDVSIEVDDGDILGVVGTSGAGKSTLVRCINLLERPDKGQVLIDGKDLMTMSAKELEKERREIGMIFQYFNLMSQRTVFRNIAYPLELRGDSKEQIKQRVTELLEVVGIPDKVYDYPSQLSGGQKQRVAIARALASQPKVLLCDEATSALDPETTKSILALLRDINKRFNLRIIIITHEKEVLKEICNKYVVLENGRVVEKGATMDLFTYMRSAAARSFVGDLAEDAHVKKALDLFSETRTDSSKAYKLTFIGEESGSPYISTISKKFDVYVSILFGNIDVIQDQTLGNLIVKIAGNGESIVSAVKYLRENQVIVQEVV